MKRKPTFLLKVSLTKENYCSNWVAYLKFKTDDQHTDELGLWISLDATVLGLCLKDINGACIHHCNIRYMCVYLCIYVCESCFWVAQSTHCALGVGWGIPGSYANSCNMVCHDNVWLVFWVNPTTWKHVECWEWILILLYVVSRYKSSCYEQYYTCDVHLWDMFHTSN